MWYEIGVSQTGFDVLELPLFHESTVRNAHSDRIEVNRHCVGVVTDEEQGSSGV